MDDLKRRLCAQTHKLYIMKMFYMSQINSKTFLHNTTISVQLPYIAGVMPGADSYLGRTRVMLSAPSTSSLQA